MMTDPNDRLQKLIRRLKSKKEVKRIHAGLLLGRMGPRAKEAVPMFQAQTASVVEKASDNWAKLRNTP